MASENEELLSWVESRRYIVAQLATMDLSIKDLGSKLDHNAEALRERTVALALENQTAIAALNVRLAVLELRAKRRNALVGVIIGIAATVAAQLILHFV